MVRWLIPLTNLIREGPRVTCKEIAGLPDTRSWHIAFLAYHTNADVQCHVDGVDHEFTTAQNREGLVVGVSNVSVSKELRISIGKEPRPSQRDLMKRLQSIIGLAQIEFQLKEQIWAVLDSKKSRISQIASLHALSLEKPMLDLLLEHLLAES